MIVIYIIGGVILAFFTLQYIMILKMKRKKGKPAPVLDGNYQKAMKKGKSLFYFYSPSCGACRPMTPIIEKIGKKHRNVFTINIQHDLDTARKFGIMGTPATVLVENGTIGEFLIGPQKEEVLQGLLG